MVENSRPNKLIKIDKHTNKVLLPSILLETRSGKVLGKISNYDNFNMSMVAIGVDEVSFDVHKYVDGVKCPIWDDLVDLKIIELQGYGRFQISVSYKDDIQTVKSVQGQSLEVELGQLTLNNFHINDEEDADMQKDEHTAHKYDSKGNFIPVVFYNEDNPDRSLLHLVLKDKAPHWSIGHVPTYVSRSEADDVDAELSNKFMRVYTEDGTSIYDFLTGTVAEETNVVFTFDTLNRVINCYNLFECKIDGQVVGNPSKDVIGEDTLVFGSKKNFVNEVSIESNEDQVKNCFRVEGGDDIITAMVAAINMTGDNYIWKIAPFQMNDMSKDLKDCIESYQKKMTDDKDLYYGYGYFEKFFNGTLALYVSSLNDAELVLSLCESNEIDTGNITKNDYMSHYWYIVVSADSTKKLYISSTVKSPYKTVISAYNTIGIYPKLCLAYEQLHFKESTLMPSLSTVDVGTAKEQYENVVEGLVNTKVYVSNIDEWSTDYCAGVTNNVEVYAMLLMDSRYDIEIIKDSIYYVKNANGSGTWKGKIRIKQNTDDTNVYPVATDDELPIITVQIGNGYKTVNGDGTETNVDGELEFMRQKVEKDLAKDDLQNLDFTSISETGKVDEQKVREFFNRFALNRLDSFYSAYDGACATLSEYGSKSYQDSDIRKELYNYYFQIKTIIGEVKDIRQTEVEDIKNTIGEIEDKQKLFLESHNFYNILVAEKGEYHAKELYKEFYSYRREDTYKNDNYNSDNATTTAEQLKRAKELMEVAQDELDKACMLQRTVSTSLSNLLVMKEFEPLYDSFALFNYIRIETDDEVLKLRLIGVEFSGDSIEEINVTFSEQVESINRSVSDLESLRNQMSSIATSFPSTTRQASKGEKANKQYIDILDTGLNATKAMITNNDNNEVTITNSGILAKRMDDEGFYGDKQLRITGNGMYLTDDAWKSLKMAVGEIFFNGQSQYGILADVICGNLIAGKNMIISNEKGTIEVNGDGIVIYDANKEKVFYADSNGNLTLNGAIYANGGKIGNLFIADKSLSYKYGFNYKILPIDEENGLHYFDYDYYYCATTNPNADVTGLAKLRCYYHIKLKAFYIKILSNVSLKQNFDTLDFETEKTRALFYYLHDGYYDFPEKEFYTSYIYFDIKGNIFLVFPSKTVSNAIAKYYLYQDDRGDREEIGYTTSSDYPIAYRELCKCVELDPDDYKEIASESEDTYIYHQDHEFLGHTGIHSLNYSEIVKSIISDEQINDNIFSSNTIYIGEKGMSVGTSFNYSIEDDSLAINKISDHIYPLEDNMFDNGISTLRWRNIYSSTSVISTSDKNKKQNISYDLDKYIKLFDKLKPCSFEFIDNSSGRTHVGYIAQDVENAMEELGMDSIEFGGLCKSKTENGDYIYSLRYDEFQGIYHAKIKTLEERIKKIEKYICEKSL